jgi:hypothetical protein
MTKFPLNLEMHRLCIDWLNEWDSEGCWYHGSGRFQ